MQHLAGTQLYLQQAGLTKSSALPSAHRQLFLSELSLAVPLSDYVKILPELYIIS
jgi:hypothetical protein